MFFVGQHGGRQYFPMFHDPSTFALISKTRPRHGDKYTKYKMLPRIIMVICIKQHLSNSWSSIHEKFRQHWGGVKEKRYLQKKRVPIKEINKLLKERNRLIDKGMSNIHLNVTIEKKSRTQNLDFLSLKSFGKLQRTQISLSFWTYCCNLKIRGLGAKLSVAFLREIMTF